MKDKFLNAKIVGVLNVSPDSFSDGRTWDRESLRKRIAKLTEDGADMLDVGAESTAPDSEMVDETEELQRLADFFTLVKTVGIPFSIDTVKSGVAEAAIRHGATVINDVSGGRADPRMLSVLAAHPDVSYVLMYSKNPFGRANRLPRTGEGDILEEICAFFEERTLSCETAGIARKRLILDPGMGAFISMDAADSVRVLQNLPRLRERFGLPIYVGTSRKGFLGKIAADRGPQDRLGSSLAAAIYAVQNGADYLRVHDVRETRQFMRVWNALIFGTDTDEK